MPINTSLRIDLERTVASLAPKSVTTGPELRFSLLSTRRLPTPKRSVVIPLTLVRNTNPFLLSNKSRTRQLWKFNSDFFHLPLTERDCFFIGTLQTFSFYQTLRVIIGGCLCLCVIEWLILVITPLLWDLTRFRYDEHVLYPLTI